MKSLWYGLCHHACAMKTVHHGILRKEPGAILLAAILAAGIVTLVQLPSPGQASAFGSSARNLFLLTEGDYLNPLITSARAVTVLNCAAQHVGRFAGYDDFSTRVNVSNKSYVAKVTRYNGNLLSLLNVRFALIEPVPAAEPLIYISESFWNTAFGRRDDILGTPLKLNESTYRIAGVTRDSSRFLGATEIWLPISGRGPLGSMSSLTILGALHAGTNWRVAQSQLVKCFAQFLQDQPYSQQPGTKLLPLETSIYFSDGSPMFVSAQPLNPSSKPARCFAKNRQPPRDSRDRPILCI